VYGTVYEVMLEVGGSAVDAILAIEDSRNFTSPPLRLPLTEAEIHNVDPCPHSMFDTERIKFARAIEAALKERNT
jgi:hypothetical protein